MASTASGRIGVDRGVVEVGEVGSHQATPRALRRPAPVWTGRAGLRPGELRRRHRRRLRRLVRRRHRRRRRRVAALAALAGGGPVLELGIGTGRLALPLAARGVEVHGVDASRGDGRAAAGQARRRPPSPSSVGDMAGDRADRPVLARVRRLQHLLQPHVARRPAACFARGGGPPGARRPLRRRGVRARPRDAPGDVGEVRSVATDRVVLAVTAHDADARAGTASSSAHRPAGGVRPPALVRPLVRTPDAARRHGGRRRPQSLEPAGADWRGEPVRPTDSRPTCRSTGRPDSSVAQADRADEPAPPQPAERPVGHDRRRAGRPARRLRSPRPLPVEADPRARARSARATRRRRRRRSRPTAATAAGSCASCPNLYPAFYGDEPLAVRNLGPVFTPGAGQRHPRGAGVLARPRRQLGRPRRRARRPRHGRPPRPHGGARPHAPTSATRRPSSTTAARPGRRSSHPHGQLLGMPFVPGEIADEEPASRRFEGGCLLCTTVEAEVEAGAPRRARRRAASWSCARSGAARPTRCS